MRTKTIENRTSRCVYADIELFKYLKKKGISISRFFRQAVNAHKSEKFEYDYEE